jgi:hypothetical protein
MNRNRHLYGVFRLTAARSELTTLERKLRDEDESWDLRNEALADALDDLLERTVMLIRPVQIGRVTHRKGAKFLVRGRVRDTFLASSLRDPALTTILNASDVTKSTEKIE